MIPHTPLLLITGAHALLRHAMLLPRWRPELPCSLEFVQAVGMTSHESLVGGRSSWPIGTVCSYAELRAMARARAWERVRAEPGDLLLLPADGEGRQEEVAIVLEVLERSLMNTHVRQCLIVVARAAGNDRMRLTEEVRWVDHRAGEVALRWYAYHGDVERAA